MSIKYKAVFAEPGTDESRKLNREWTGAWYVAEYTPKRPSQIVSYAFNTEAMAKDRAEVMSAQL